MNNLYPNSGRDTKCVPESPVPFLPPPSNQRKGSGLRVYTLVDGRARPRPYGWGRARPSSSLALALFDLLDLDL